MAEQPASTNPPSWLERLRGKRTKDISLSPAAEKTPAPSVNPMTNLAGKVKSISSSSPFSRKVSR